MTAVGRHGIHSATGLCTLTHPEIVSKKSWYPLTYQEAEDEVGVLLVIVRDFSEYDLEEKVKRSRCHAGGIGGHEDQLEKVNVLHNHPSYIPENFNQKILAICRWFCLLSKYPCQ
jgi:hypothetical protein